MSATNTDWTALQQAENRPYFKADLCCYSLEKKKAICNEMVSTSKAVLVGEGDPLYREFQAISATLPQRRKTRRAFVSPPSARY